MEEKIPQTCSDQAALEFLNLVIKLNPPEFLGVAKVMGVGLMRNKAEVEAEAALLDEEAKTQYIKDNSVRKAELITSDMVDRFFMLNRAQRRNLMKIIRSAATRG